MIFCWHRLHSFSFGLCKVCLCSYISTVTLHACSVIPTDWCSHRHESNRHAFSCAVGFVPTAPGARSPGLSLPQLCVEVLQGEQLRDAKVQKKRNAEQRRQRLSLRWFTCRTPQMCVGDATAELYNCRQHDDGLWR